MESLKQAAVVPVREETQVAAARRTAGEYCRRMGLQPETAARAELVSVELASNVLRHGGSALTGAGLADRGTGLAGGAAGAHSGGALIFAAATAADALHVIAVDQGAGIGSVERAMEDGFTTGTTPGTGLGTVRRAAQCLDVYSRPGAGTVIAVELHDVGTVESKACEEAVLSTSLDRDPLNGDSWAILRSGVGGAGRTIYIVADGLGHGLYASEASAMAVEIARTAFGEDSKVSLPELLRRMHGPMHATRGAAVSLVSVEGSLATCCGVGNVTTLLYAPDAAPGLGTAGVGRASAGRSIVSHNGTVGHQMRRVQEFQVPVEPGTLLVMYSDGLMGRWKMDDYPGLQRRSPATIAGVLYRDALRGRDDATVLVARLGGGAA